jgi:hypothetical protein
MNEATIIRHAQLIIAPITMTAPAVIHTQTVSKDPWVQQFDVSVVVSAEQAHP